jgi:predicted XRE-type DNA-binding protein
MTGQPFASVWDALSDTHEEALSLKAKADVMRHIQGAVESWAQTQSAAAERLGISQPRLNDLLRGRLDRFSLDTLVDLAGRAGLQVDVSVSPRAA